MGKADGLSRHSGEDKSSMEAKSFDKGQLLDLEEDDAEERGDADHVEQEAIDDASWEKKNGLWVVLEDYKLEGLRQHHDSQVAGHWGRHRTQELISRNFVWDKWQEDVARYVAGYAKCQKANADRHTRQTKLIPMPTEEHPFEEIAMDFVAKLAESEGFNAILFITDRFTKIQQYIPAKMTWTAEDVANIYITEIWRLYGLLRHITSDCGPQFASRFLRELNRKLNICLCLSTAYHPQTDGLSKRAIQTLKQYLRIFCHDRQKQWKTWLILTEFAYNTTTHSTHQYSSYGSQYG